jgi:methylmalonyl-CoA mutase N-terminal domain/subunit
VPETLRVADRVAGERRARLAAVRARRDASRVAALRDALRQAARSDAPLMPAIVAAVDADVTLGEICDDLRGVFGAYRPAAVAT